MTPPPPFEIGDVIEYITYDDTYRIVRVTGIEKNAKNGKDVFDGTILKTNGNSCVGTGVWGYFNQVKRVVKDDRRL